MNRGLGNILLIMLAVVLACDTSNTVEPRNESFFFKLYSGLIAGDDMAADITTTLDNGLAFVGTSYQGSEGPTANAEMLVVKTGIDGNEQWKFSSSSVKADEKIRGNSILALNDGSAIIAGGTSGDKETPGNVPFLFTLDPATGAFIDSLSFRELPNPNPNYFYELKSITQTHSYLVLSGETDQPSPTGGGGVNGFIAIAKVSNGSLSLPQPPEFSFPIAIFGLDGDEVIAGAFEIQDTIRATSIGPRFSAFCGTFENSNYDFKTYQFNRDLSPVGSDEIAVESGNQIPVSIARNGDTYFVLGNTTLPENQMYIQHWDFDTWSDRTQGRIGNSSNVAAKGIDFKNSFNIYLVGDLFFPVDNREEIFLTKVGSGLDVINPWPRLFGASGISYNSSAVKVLPDGSIVTLGTANLEPTKKIVLIKTGPNGEMSFE